MLGQPIAAEVTPSASHLRRWACIYPYTISISGFTPHQYQLFDVELLRDELPNYEGDEDLITVHSHRYYLNSISELDELLAHLKIDPQLFDSPWTVDYPF
ncbi:MULTISPECIES: hypothetical protein [Hymenobacter]|uniref:Uncharacterized protein n=1 Tax=Hymenobacter defluvii TaxID=2054411 RepID=A0ABS3TCQ9_9BACT|nr:MULTISPECIES: hypothetical protein [Hymenobacter]MBO3271447.1 hypothetical protein [Hymenobacter defluvii]